ncbi:MAG: Hsp20/alpha crystallin family protein [Anaerolineales bacterium]
MSSLMRWEPFREALSLRDWMDRFMDEAWSRPVAALGGITSPAIDMYQTDDDVVVKATLPGVRPEDLNIAVTGDLLTIRGESKEESNSNGVNYHVRERRYGSFSRTLPLPTAVLADKAQADFENGILTLTLPKAEEVKPKTITVKARS